MTLTKYEVFFNNELKEHHKTTNKIYNIIEKTQEYNIVRKEIRLSRSNINFKINFDTQIHDFINEIKFEFSIFREAFINQRKQYKLLKAYINLENELITDEEYDEIEELYSISIHNHDYETTEKAIYHFLLNHEEFVEDYDVNELSELLGLNYKKVNRIIKDRKKEYNEFKKISSK